MLHCFQEVHSHQHSVQAEDLETVQALQAMELDGRACVCVLLLAAVYARWHVSVCAQKDDSLRTGFVKKVFGLKLEALTKRIQKSLMSFCP